MASMERERFCDICAVKDDPKPEPLTEGGWSHLMLAWAKREGHRRRVRVLGYEEAHR